MLVGVNKTEFTLQLRMPDWSASCFRDTMYSYCVGITLVIVLLRFDSKDKILFKYFGM